MDHKELLRVVNTHSKEFAQRFISSGDLWSFYKDPHSGREVIYTQPLPDIAAHEIVAVFAGNIGEFYNRTKFDEASGRVFSETSYLQASEKSELIARCQRLNKIPLPSETIEYGAHMLNRALAVLLYKNNNTNFSGDYNYCTQKYERTLVISPLNFGGMAVGTVVNSLNSIGITAMAVSADQELLLEIDWLDVVRQYKDPKILTQISLCFAMGAAAELINSQSLDCFPAIEASSASIYKNVEAPLPSFPLPPNIAAQVTDGLFTGVYHVQFQRPASNGALLARDGTLFKPDTSLQELKEGVATAVCPFTCTQADKKSPIFTIKANSVAVDQLTCDRYERIGMDSFATKYWQRMDCAFRQFPKIGTAQSFTQKFEGVLQQGQEWTEKIQARWWHIKRNMGL